MRRAWLAVLLAMTALSACRDDTPSVTPTSTSTQVQVTTTAIQVTTTAALPAAPWAAAKLRTSQVPAVLLTEWRAGGARANCAALAPAELGTPAPGTARRAEFGAGAWAVAWDVPGAPGRLPSGEPCANCGRGTVFVAGTGVDVAPARPGRFTFPNTIRWADGSVAQYGLEGGSGPAFLAHLEVAGQACLYNVGSFLGQAHLERLLGSLRFVEGAP